MARENKPNFVRRGWHKLIRLGSTVKKKRKWRAAKGRQNKIRLERRGQQAKPKIGWGNESGIKGKIGGMDYVRVENVKELSSVKKGQAIIIGSVGLRKRSEIISAANEKNIKILNKYKENKNATK
jgi:ribosomal protein L32E